MKKIITNVYHYRNHKYVLLKTDELFDPSVIDYTYYAVDYDLLDNAGRLKDPCNVAQLNGSKTLKECIERVKNKCDLEYYESIGYSKAHAFAIVYNMLDRLEDLEKVFNEL